MAKAETLLKVVLTPLDPPEGVIKNYLILSTNNEAAGGDEPTSPATTSAQSMTPQRLQELKDGLVKILDLKARTLIL